MAEPSGQNKGNVSGSLGAFDIRQLEEELARRKRKYPGSGSSDTPIDLTDDLDEERIDTPMNNTTPPPGIPDADATIKVENGDAEIVEVKIENENDGEDTEESAQRPRKRSRKEPTPALYKAKIRSLAQTGTSTVTPSNVIVDNKVFKKIRQCIARSEDPGTTENEVKIALRLMHRLMQQHNISRADVPSEDAKAGQKRNTGESVVTLLRSDGNTDAVIKEYTWADRLVSAMETFFDCKCYLTCNDQRTTFKFVFVGIAENTVTAAMVYEWAYNMISEWARHYTGTGPKNSYLLGVSWQLYTMAKEEQDAEEARAIEAERKAKEAFAARIRQEKLDDEARLKRLQPIVEEDEVDDHHGSDEQLGGRNAADSDDDSESESNGFGDDDVADPENEDLLEPDFIGDDDSLDMNSDLEEQIRREARNEFAPRTKSPKSPPSVLPFGQNPFSAHRQLDASLSSNANPPEDDDVGLEPDLEPTWADRMQLMTFRENAWKLADDYLVEKGVKLRAGRKRNPVVRDRKAYEQGKEDGKTIDVHQKFQREDPEIKEEEPEIKQEPEWEDDVQSC